LIGFCSQCIAEFQQSHPAVVDKLRELKDCSECYRDAPSSSTGETQTDVDERGVGTASDDEGPWNHGDRSEAWTQSDAVDSVDVATQRHSMNCATGDDDNRFTIGTMTEEQLKEKHDKVCLIFKIYYLFSDAEKKPELQNMTLHSQRAITRRILALSLNLYTVIPNVISSSSAWLRHFVLTCKVLSKYY